MWCSFHGSSHIKDIWLRIYEYLIWLNLIIVSAILFIHTTWHKHNENSIRVEIVMSLLKTWLILDIWMFHIHKYHFYECNAVRRLKLLNQYLKLPTIPQSFPTMIHIHSYDMVRVVKERSCYSKHGHDIWSAYNSKKE